MRLPVIALVGLLAACAPVTTLQITASAKPILANSKVGLTFYPNSKLLKFEEKKDGSSQVDFAIDDDLEKVYAFFHQQLSEKGWFRWTLKRSGFGKTTKIEATYQRKGELFKFRLDADSSSDRYKMEIEF